MPNIGFLDRITIPLFNNIYIYDGLFINFINIVGTMLILFMMTLSILVWLNYYLDVTFITSRHLVNIRQAGLFNRRVVEQPLARVQDVSSKMHGFFQTLFHFGTVYVETAGEAPNFVMKYISTPHRVANAIMKLHEEIVKESVNEDIMLIKKITHEKKISKTNEVVKELTVPNEHEELTEQESQRLENILEDKIAESSEDEISFIDLVNKDKKDHSQDEGELKEGRDIKL